MLGGVQHVTPTRFAIRKTVEATLEPWLFSRARLLKLCLRFAHGNLFEAEDLLSEAFLRAMEAQTRGFEVRSPLGFSATVIKNVARDRRRAAIQRRERWAVFDEDMAASPSSELSPERQASAREGLSNALRALESMPHNQRFALLLRCLGDDYSCIAREVGTTAQNARKLVQVARAAVCEQG